MDRIKIKEKAKELINNNLWTIWKPILVIALISVIVTLPLTSMGEDTSMYNIISTIIDLFLLPLEIGTLYYTLRFIRKQDINLSMIFEKFNKLLPIIAVWFVVFIVVIFGTFLLIVPGIIFAISYSMVFYILADMDEDIKTLDILSKSREMMYGHKWDYVVFQLSFLGWIILSMLTCGLLLIYVIPYISVSNALYYENVKKLNK